MSDTELYDPVEVDEPIPPNSLVEQNAFLGEVSYETIRQGITDQFTDYIGTEDKTNYVEIFYRQLDASYEACGEDDEEHPSEKIEILDNLNTEFSKFIEGLLEQKLALHVSTGGREELETDDYRRVIITAYEGLILNAKSNFMRAITSDILKKVHTSLPANCSDDEWYDIIRDLLNGYSPIVTEISPLMFLRYIQNDELISIYESEGLLTGNFLRKYSPRLFQNNEFEVELIANITMAKDVKEELYASATDKHPEQN